LSIDFDDKIFSEKLNSRTIALECYEKIISESKNFQNPGIYEIENIGDLPEITESYSLYINESIDSTTYN